MYFKVFPQHEGLPFKDIITKFKGIGIDIEEKDLCLYFNIPLELDSLEKSLMYNIGIIIDGTN